MKNYFGKALPLLIIVILMLLAVPGEAGAFGYGNDGSEDYPYRIETAEQLATVEEAVYLDKHFILVSDIDLADYLSEGGDGFNDGAGWVPIGTATTPFNGSFNGNGHTISNLFIGRPTADYVGLFGSISSADIQNISLAGDTIVYGKDYVGGLVGKSDNSTITESYAAGSVIGSLYVGGLMGQSDDSTVTDCYTSCTVMGQVMAGGLVGYSYNGTINESYATGAVGGNDYIGGLAGKISSDTVTASYATGSVVGQEYVGGLVGLNEGGATIIGSYALGSVTGSEQSTGGLVGQNYSGTVTASHAKGSVTGNFGAGGLVGVNSDGAIAESYATGAVTGSLAIGGLAGFNQGTVTESYATGTVTGSFIVGGLLGGNEGAVTESYATGTVTGSSPVGGLVGDNEGAVTASYYNKDTTGQSDTGKGEPKTTAELQTPTTFAGWDFAGSWGINPQQNESYPFLRWQQEYTDAQFAGGTGEMGTPYQVATPWQLNNIRMYLNLNYILSENIDMSTYLSASGDGYNSGAGWEPIGTSGAPFTGTFDGGGHTIGSLLINRPDTDEVGLFGYVEDAVIRNTHLADAAVTGRDYVGGLAGINHGMVSGSCLAGVVQGRNSVGGLAGRNYYNGSITGSFANCAVAGTDYVGGLAGTNHGGAVTASYAVGDVTGSSIVGGLVGYNDRDIIRSYALGAVTGEDFTGGLVGHSHALSNSAGSLWGMETSGLADSAGGTGKTSAEMKTYSAFYEAGWDFIGETENGDEDYWGIDESITDPVNNGYPFLAWQGYDHKIRPAVTTGEVDDITAKTAAVQGEITYLGYPGNPTQHGVVWSEEVNPTLDDSITEEGAASATGTFTSTITGLEPDTVYYVRAYVTNAAGTFYGEQVQFITTESPGTVNIAVIPGVTAPATGGTPVTAITGTDQYTGTVSWSPGHNPFQGATVYTATVTLTAKAGFTFEGVAAGFFTMAGSTSMTNDADSGIVTAIFPVTEAAPDPQYITVTDTSPADGATDVSRTPTVTLTFSDNIQADSGYGDITLKDAGSSTVNISKNISGQVLTITPEGNLTYGTTYTVTVPADAVKNADAEANLAGQFQFSFTTRPAPTGGGGGGGSPAPKPATETSKKINAATGGTVSLGDVSVHIPAGALPDDATFSIRKLTQKEMDEIVPEGLRLKLAGDIYDITTTGSRDFGESTITIKIPYDPDKIAAGEAPVINYYDEEIGAWTALETSIEQDADGKWYAVVKVNHLTKFAVFSTAVVKPAQPQKVIKLTIGSTETSIDGQPCTLDAAPFVKPEVSRILVPLRFVSEALGALVDWRAEMHEVIIRENRNGQQVEIILTIGSGQALVNNAPLTLDCPAELHPSGRTFVPLRLVSETLGSRVEWDAIDNTVNITR